MEQTVIWPCTEEITVSSRTVQHRREQLSSVQHSRAQARDRPNRANNRQNCREETFSPLLSLTLAERRLVAHAPSAKADLCNRVQCCGSLYSKCHFLQKRSDVVKTDQTAPTGHTGGITRVQYVSSWFLDFSFF